MPTDRTATIGPTNAFTFDETSNILYSVGVGQITRWDTVARAFLSPIIVPSSQLADIAVSQDGRYLVIGERNPIANVGTLYRIDLQDQSITTITYPQLYGDAGVASIAISASGEVAFTTFFPGSGSTGLRVFNLNDAAPVVRLQSNATFMSSSGIGPSLATSADGRLILIGETSSSTGLTIYDTVTHQLSQTQRAQQGLNFDQTAISSSGLVAAASFNTLFIYNAQLQLVHDFSYRMIQQKITDIEFSPDGRLFYAWNATTDLIEVWDTGRWFQLASLDPEILVDSPSTAPSSFGRMQLSDDGRLLILNTLSGVRILDLEARLVLPTIVEGTPGADALVGGDGVDILIGGAGADSLTGGSGADVFRYFSVSDTTTAAPDFITDFQPGLDRIDFTDLSGPVVPSQITRSLTLTRSSDGITTISGTDLGGGSFRLDARGDVNLSDIVYGWHGVTLVGSARGDTLIGGVFDDTATGGAGNDTIIGGDGADVLDGGLGEDRLEGGLGGDRLIGGSGNDTLIGGAGADEIQGGIGFDTVVYSGARSTYSISLSGSTWLVDGLDGRDTANTIEAFQFLDGTYDVFAPGRLAGQARMTLTGTVGDDVMTGGESNDTLSGGAGNDTLNGQIGSDVLNGGDGVDTALYAGARRQYTASSTSVSGGPEGGTDTLTSIEGARFIDGTLTFDVNSQAAQVMRLYDAALDRNGDPGGLESLLDRLERGESLVSLAGAFLTSPEFQQRYGALNNQAFIEQMYRFCLNREGDAGGIQTWTDRLNSGTTRAEMLVIFSESQEYRDLTAATLAQGLWVADEAALTIARLYDAAFDRAPDVGGLATWTNNLRGGMPILEIAAAFASAPEFQQRYGTVTNQQFIEQMYRFCLNREPDAGGLQTWLGRLNSGTSRAEMLLIFSDSAEHISLTAPQWLGGIRYFGAPASPTADDAKSGADEAQVLPMLHDDGMGVVKIDDRPLVNGGTGYDLGLKAFDAFFLPATPDNEALTLPGLIGPRTGGGTAGDRMVTDEIVGQFDADAFVLPATSDDQAPLVLPANDEDLFLMVEAAGFGPERRSGDHALTLTLEPTGELAVDDLTPWRDHNSGQWT